MIAIADATKQVPVLGTHPLPLEVLEFARGFVSARITELGGEARPREGALTDQGNPLLDCHFGAIDDPERLASRLEAIPGILAHGLFLREVDVLCVGTNMDTHWFERRADPKSAPNEPILETKS
jgi:ribose 5-phosphate isomerase A